MHRLHKGAWIHVVKSPLLASKPLQTIAQPWRLEQESLHVQILGQRSFDFFLMRRVTQWCSENVNVAKSSGNGSLMVVKKIHNMPWLKRGTMLKNSGQGIATGGTMVSPLDNLKDDGQTLPKRTKKRRKNKSRRAKENTNVTRKTEIVEKSNNTPIGSNARRANDLVTNVSHLSVAGQLGVGTKDGSTDNNTVGELSVEAAEEARNQLCYEEQLKKAVAASLETAFLEKCAMDPPEENNVKTVILHDEENVWDGMHKNLPSPRDGRLETVRDFDTNNNACSNELQSSSLVTKKSEGKVEIQQMEAVYTRLKTCDPMLYNLLMKRGRRTTASRNVLTHAVGHATKPEQRPSETLNPDAKPFSPIAKQACITHDQQNPMLCHSMHPNYNPECSYVQQPPDMLRQDNSGWISTETHQFHAAVHPGHYHSDYANKQIPILDHLRYLVSEQHLSCKNAQCPVNMQQFKHDYIVHGQTVGFDDTSTDPQRQLPYRALHRQSGIVPNQFCSMDFGGSYGNPNQTMSEIANYGQHAVNPPRQYTDHLMKNENSMNSKKKGNGRVFKGKGRQIRGFVHHGFDERQPMALDDKPLLPKRGRRGRGQRGRKFNGKVPFFSSS